MTFVVSVVLGSKQQQPQQQQQQQQQQGASCQMSVLDVQRPHRRLEIQWRCCG
jgi:hypothetical protein